MKVLLILLASQIPQPDADSMKQAESKLKSMFQAEYARKTPGDLRELAVLFRQNASSGYFQEPGMRYVAFREAASMFVKIEEPWEATRCAESMGQVFSVDVFREKQSILSKVSAAPGSELQSSVAHLTYQLAFEAAYADRFDEAAKLFSSADSMAAQCRDPGLREACAAARQLLDSRRSAFQKSRAGGVDLGRWLCLFKGAWEEGLPNLAQGKDKAAEAARLELSGTASPLQISDAWWEAASKEKGVPREAMRARALLSASKDAGLSVAAVTSDRASAFDVERYGDKVECIPGVAQRTSGMVLMPEIGDGRCVVGYSRGVPSLKTGLKETGPCAYFKVSSGWVAGAKTVEISVEYLDSSGSIYLNAAEVSGYVTPPVVQMGGTNSWKTYTARVPAASLSGALHGADWRVVTTGPGLVVRRATARKISKP